jgi:hypothetical protein
LKTLARVARGASSNHAEYRCVDGRYGRDSAPGLFVAAIDVKRWYHFEANMLRKYAAANFGMRR